MEFSRQEYWSRLPFPTPGALSHPGIESVISYVSCTAGRFFILSSLKWQTMFFQKDSQLLHTMYSFCALLPTSHFEPLPSPDSGLRRGQVQHASLPALVGRGMLFIQFGTGGRVLPPWCQQRGGRRHSRMTRDVGEQC